MQLTAGKIVGLDLQVPRSLPCYRSGKWPQSRTVSRPGTASSNMGLPGPENQQPHNTYTLKTLPAELQVTPVQDEQSREGDQLSELGFPKAALISIIAVAAGSPGRAKQGVVNRTAAAPEE